MIGRWQRPLVVALLAGALSSGCATGPAPQPSSSGPGPTPVSTALVGTSGEGRPIHAHTVGRGPLRLYVIGGIHGDEIEGRDGIDDLCIAFAAPPMCELATLRVVDDVNPDGTARGRRGSASGVDLNRNWPARNHRPRRSAGPAPLSEPEVRAVHADMLTFRPDLIVVLHSTPSGPFVNFDGPADEPASAFADAARAVDPRWRVKPEMDYPTPGSIGSCWGRDRQVPILTIEFDRGSGRDGDTAVALVAGMRAIVTPTSATVAAVSD